MEKKTWTWEPGTCHEMNRQPDKQKKDPIYRELNDEGSGNT